MRKIHIYLIIFFFSFLALTSCKQEDDFDLRIPDKAKPDIQDSWTATSGNATLRKGGRTFVTESPVVVGNEFLDIDLQLTLTQTANETKTLTGYKMEIGHEPELLNFGFAFDFGYDSFEEVDSLSYELSPSNPFVLDININSRDIDNWYWGQTPVIGSGEHFQYGPMPSEQLNVRYTFFFSDGTYIRLPQMNIFWVTSPDFTSQK